MTTRPDIRRSLGVKILSFCLLAAFGALAGYVSARFIDIGAVPWQDVVVVFMAVVLIVMAIATAVVMATRPAHVPKGCGLLQIVVLALAGVMYLAPLYAGAWVGADVVFGAVVVLLAVQTLANVMLWRRADEMLRRVMWETCAVAFGVSQAALFLHAAAERLGLVDPVSSWGLIGIMMAIYILASSVVAARRGLS